MISLQVSGEGTAKFSTGSDGLTLVSSFIAVPRCEVGERAGQRTGRTWSAGVWSVWERFVCRCELAGRAAGCERTPTATSRADVAIVLGVTWLRTPGGRHACTALHRSSITTYRCRPPGSRG